MWTSSKDHMLSELPKFNLLFFLIKIVNTLQQYLYILNYILNTKAFYLQLKFYWLKKWDSRIEQCTYKE